MGERFTSLLNALLGGSVTDLEGLVGIRPDNPSQPIPEYVSMQILVFVLLIILLAVVRTRLSVDKPGKLQQVFELILAGLKSQAEDIIGHGGERFVPMLFCLAVFIFLSNVLGLVPGLESPTGIFVPNAESKMAGIAVTVGCALVVLAYYHYWGIHHHGVAGYIRTFMGPIGGLAALPLMLLMLVIEIVSHLARGLSLSVRLYANMFAGHQISLVFFSLLPVAVPVIFEGLHVFVALLQTFIFVLLTMVYLAGAVSEEH